MSKIEAVIIELSKLNNDYTERMAIVVCFFIRQWTISFFLLFLGARYVSGQMAWAFQRVKVRRS
jgi:hypothetical protein